MRTNRNDRAARGALAGGITAALLAGAMALGINMGILGAIGEPGGPGRLGAAPVALSLRHGTPPRPDAGPASRVEREPSGVPGTPGSTPAAPGGARPSPAHTGDSHPSAEPAQTTRATPGTWSPDPAWSADAVHPPEIEHEFGAQDDD